MEILTGILLGFIGSFHCIGMCGPVAVSVCSARGIKYMTAYNSGRIITYSLLGLLFGFAGAQVEMLGLQKFISISTGVIIVIALFTPALSAVNFTKYFLVIPLMIRHMKLYIRSSNPLHALIIGMLNGILPCGFVYLAIAGSISTGDAVNGALFMISFGLGTLPAMLGISQIGKVLNFKFRNFVRKLLPVFTFAIAVLFILRGLGVGMHNLPLFEQKKERNEVICR